MKEFIAYLVKNLVDEPESVEITCTEGPDGMRIELRTAEKDVGKVIGKRGCTINALRTIVAVLSARFKKKIRVELIDTSAREKQAQVPIHEEVAVQDGCTG